MTRALLSIAGFGMAGFFLLSLLSILIDGFEWSAAALGCVWIASAIAVIYLRRRPTEAET